MKTTCRKSSKASNSKTASRSSYCRLTTPPDQPRHPISRIARGILQGSSRGSFDSIELSVNEDFLAVRDHLSRFFHDRAPDDLLLLYYSGHGILGRGNRLFLATAGSNLDTPRDRSVSAKEIRDFIEDSRAERQIVVLDCCHSGLLPSTPRRLSLRRQ